MDPLLEQFLSEAQDNLSFLDANLSQLESGDEEQINALFRAAHTLKGGAGLVGFEAVKEITHAAEDLLDAYRNHKIGYSEELLNTLYDAFDEVVELVEACEAEGSIEALEVDSQKIAEIKAEILSHLNAPSDEKAEADVSLAATEEPPFPTVQRVGLDHLTLSQLESVLSLLNQSDAAWVLDLDLDVETLNLGNDPFYFIELLEPEKVVAIETEVFHCEQLAEDPSQWLTHLKLVTTASLEQIEEAFYNVLFEIEGCPLSLECLLPSLDPALEGEANQYLPKLLTDDLTLEQLEALLSDCEPELLKTYLYRVGQFQVLKQGELIQALLPQLDQEGASSAQESEKAQETQAEVLPELTDFDKQQAVALLEVQKVVLAQAEDLTQGLQTVGLILPKVARFVSEQMLAEVEAALKSAEQDQVVEVIDHLIEQFGGTPAAEVAEISEPSKPFEPQVAKVEKPAGQAVEKPMAKTAKKSSVSPQNPQPGVQEPRKVSTLPKTIKIDPEEIDFIMDTVGELLVVKNALPFIAEKLDAEQQGSIKRDLINKYEQLSRLVQQLQDRVMGMRLLPLSYIFNRYPKLIRDISKSLSKKIVYQEYGGDTQLDKMMIEKLADPMIHIIRNSLDHGIESPEERLAQGKSKEGHLTVGAKSEGDRVLIEVSDDGRGIDLEKVVHKALEKQLVSAEELEAMSESERLALIFLPGLSTKEAISELSGRGVGADAVKTTVESLGGQVHVESTQGLGTKVILDLPVSAALTNVFQVEMGGNFYAINMQQVVETEKVTREEIKTVNHQWIIQLRGEVIPLILNAQLLNRTTLNAEEKVLILMTPIGKVAFVVDQFMDQLDVVQKPLEGPLQNHPFISGVALLGDGSPLFVLSIKHLFKD